MQVTPTGSLVVEATADVPGAAPEPVRAPRRHEAGAGPRIASARLWRNVEELIAATDWLPHTTRAALTGLRKRGYAVTIDRHDKGRGSMYRARSDETIGVDQAGPKSGDASPAISATPKSSPE